MLKELEGYQIKTIFKFMAKKEGFGLAECGTAKKEEQQRTVLEALKNGGNVFGIYKKEELQACYVFEKTRVAESEIPYPKYDLNKENAWDFIIGHDVPESQEDESEADVFNDIAKDLEEMGKMLSELEIKDEKDDKQVSILRLKEMYNASVPAAVLEQFEKAIITEFKELIVISEVKAIIWNEKILVPKKVKVAGSGYINAISLGICIGVGLGIALDNIVLGILLGILWGLAFGSAFTSIGNKK